MAPVTRIDPTMVRMKASLARSERRLSHPSTGWRGADLMPLRTLTRVKYINENYPEPGGN